VQAAQTDFTSRSCPDRLIVFEFYRLARADLFTQPTSGTFTVDGELGGSSTVFVQRITEKREQVREPAYVIDENASVSCFDMLDDAAVFTFRAIESFPDALYSVHLM